MRYPCAPSQIHPKQSRARGWTRRVWWRAQSQEADPARSPLATCPIWSSRTVRPRNSPTPATAIADMREHHRGSIDPAAAKLARRRKSCSQGPYRASSWTRLVHAVQRAEANWREGPQSHYRSSRAHSGSCSDSSRQRVLRRAEDQHGSPTTPMCGMPTETQDTFVRYGLRVRSRSSTRTTRACGDPLDSQRPDQQRLAACSMVPRS
jgi:hypothetical protein